MRIVATEPFIGLKPDKEQAVKVLEEAAELYAAWQLYEQAKKLGDEKRVAAAARHFEDEAADVVQAVGNLCDSEGVNDLRRAQKACTMRNRLRGRYGKAKRGEVG